MIQHRNTTSVSHFIFKEILQHRPAYWKVTHINQYSFKNIGVWEMNVPISPKTQFPST